LDSINQAGFPVNEVAIKLTALVPMLCVGIHTVLPFLRGMDSGAEHGNQGISLTPWQKDSDTTIFVLTIIGGMTLN